MLTRPTIRGTEHTHVVVQRLLQHMQNALNDKSRILPARNFQAVDISETTRGNLFSELSSIPLACPCMEYQVLCIVTLMKHTNPAPKPSQNLPSKEDTAFAADVLIRSPKGFLPFELFLAVAARVTTPTMELAPLRQKNNGALEILLTQRPADDPYWPNGWHMPGTVLRATDKEGDFSSGIERILCDELHGKVPMRGTPVYVTTKFWDVLRGRELDTVYYFKTDVADSDLAEGKFFAVDDLPDTTLAHHKIIITEIAAVFRLRNGNASVI